MALPGPSYGKFGDHIHLDEEKLAKAYQLLWEYLHMRLRQRRRQYKRKFFVTRRISIPLVYSPLSVVRTIRFPESAFK